MNEKKQPSLQIGLQLDKWPEARVPVLLRPTGLAAHTAIIAQSGSGKSYMLGRFLEELVGKTKAKLLILDPNSDFASFRRLRFRVFPKGKCNQIARGYAGRFW